ncbi:hypothetical protein [Aphanizomenon flos-aquae]|jgi:hypothetical protein|uniref:Uncharacterized protein n=1 Tax=Aphanizomenon flos-aquae FACHB-1040 TaxID=2692887 RepID=A0ABR8C2F3_APHFL|nr:hypothetical protein [Aphanizomenon flos-aquae]MBD2280585.1 hypothetical protein [Aphanizomenon flos-aquae FACHB-1040]
MRKFNFLIAPPHPQTAIALPHPKQRSLSHTPNSDRIPTSLNAIALLKHPQKRSHSQHPQQAIALPTSPNSDSYGALRYRTPRIPKSDRIGKLIFLLNSVEIFIN